MKAILRLRPEVCPDQQLSVVSEQPSALGYQQSELSCQRSLISHQAKLWLIPKTYYRLSKNHLLVMCKQPSALDSWFPAKSLIPKAYNLIAFLILVFVSCGAALAQESVVQTTPAAKADDLVVPKGGIVIGDTLPEGFWEQELNVVSHPDNIKKIKLSDYRHKLLVLDFWANYCAPCLESIDTWELLQPQFPDEVDVLLVHIFYSPEKAKPFADKKGWKLPVAAGNENAAIINKLFYAQGRFGQVWIKDGKLLAIPKHQMASREVISKVLTDKKVEIEMDDYLTYFDKRHFIDNEEPVQMDN